MNREAYFDSQAEFNKWLKELTKEERNHVEEMLSEYSEERSRGLRDALTRIKELTDYQENGVKNVLSDIAVSALTNYNKQV